MNIAATWALKLAHGGAQVEGESEVGFIDVEAVEWWTLVPTSTGARTP